MARTGPLSGAGGPRAARITSHSRIVQILGRLDGSYGALRGAHNFTRGPRKARITSHSRIEQIPGRPNGSHGALSGAHNFTLKDRANSRAPQWLVRAPARRAYKADTLRLNDSVWKHFLA